MKEKLELAIIARSGHAGDIQDAIDLAAAEYEKDVSMPEGQFSFYERGETWIPVTVDLALFPAGMNLFGALTPRDAYDQVIDWRTVLVMAEDQPNGTLWFWFLGDGDPAKRCRFSDTKLSGYRDIDPTSSSRHSPLALNRMIDFRIDHNYFSHTTDGLGIGGLPTRGVLDHNRIVNLHNIVIADPARTVGYGVYVQGESANTFWEPDITKVLGKYTDYTVFIEDNYVQGWRHCVASNYGMHYVFRRNTIQYDVGYGSLDAHGTTAYVGTRAVEVYENQLLDSTSRRGAIWIRGGGGVVFNNTVRGYDVFTSLYNEGTVEKCWPHDLWIWNNNLEPGITLITPSSSVENVDYFLHEMPGYTRYRYPHWLVSGTPMHTLNVKSTPISQVPFNIRRL